MTLAESETFSTTTAAADGRNIDNSWVPDSNLNGEIEMFFCILFILLAVIAFVKIREQQSQVFRYEPL